MNKDKDYYFILGLYPSVELDVIKASYHRYCVLLQNTNKIKTIAQKADREEGFVILTDDKKKSAYDLLRGKQLYLAEQYFDEHSEQTLVSYDDFDTLWDEATQKYSDLTSYVNLLNQLSWRLSNSFKLYVIDKNAFIPRHNIALHLEAIYLGHFFSHNKFLMDFGKMLILHRERKAAKALNQLVVFSPEEILPEKLINQILSQYAIKAKYLSNLLIYVAMHLEPKLVKVYLKAGANVNILVDGNQSLLAHFNHQFGFMRYKGNEVSIGKRYEIERIFSQYDAKKIDIRLTKRKKLLELERRKKWLIKSSIFCGILFLWLVYVNSI